MSFEIWNSTTRNLYGSYGNRKEAMRAALAILETYGDEAVTDLILASEDSRGETTRIAAGEALARLARDEGRASDAPPQPQALG